MESETRNLELREALVQNAGVAEVTLIVARAVLDNGVQIF